MLLSAYRRDDYADPKAFILQLGTVLQQYPAHVVERVTSPLTGLQRKLKFPPTLQEVVEACDAEMEHERIISQPKVQISRTSWTPSNRANLFVRNDLAAYPKMLERARKADECDFSYSDKPPGIWVPLGWFEEAKRG